MSTDVFVQFDDGEWVCIDNGSRLSAGTDTSEIVREIYSTVTARDNDGPLLLAVLAAVQESIDIDHQDVRELRVVVESPDTSDPDDPLDGEWPPRRGEEAYRPDSSRSETALVLEDVLSHLASWQPASPVEHRSAVQG